MTRALPPSAPNSPARAARLHRPPRRRASRRIRARRRRAPGLADRLHRQRRAGRRAARPRRGVHRRALRAAAAGADRSGAVGAPPHHRGPAAGLARRARPRRRAHRLRPAADQRGGAAALPRRRPRHGRRRAPTRSMRSGPTARRRRSAAAVPHALAQAGRDSADKRADLAAALREARQDAAVLTDPASIAWLLNIRGADVPFTPFALGFAILHADGAHRAVHGAEKLPDATRAWLGNAVSVQPRAALPARWPAWPAGGCGWMPPPRRSGSPRPCARPAPPWSPAWTPACCPRPARTRSSSRARATPMRATPSRSAASCTGSTAPPATPPNWTPPPACSRSAPNRPSSAARASRRFPAPASTAPSSTTASPPETNRPINPDELYLIDSGAQYADGTTDVTRTIWTGPGDPPAELRDRVTRVLKGHIAIATLVFPQGVAGPHLDAFARARAVAGRAGLRPRHRPRRRQLSVGARGPGQPVARGQAGADRRRA